MDRVSPASGASLEVSFHGKPISPGQLVRPGDAKAAPRIAVQGGSEGGLFTVVASDPDPPDPAAPRFREWLVSGVGAVRCDDQARGRAGTAGMAGCRQAPRPPNALTARHLDQRACGL